MLRFPSNSDLNLIDPISVTLLRKWSYYFTLGIVIYSPLMKTIESIKTLNTKITSKAHQSPANGYHH